MKYITKECLFCEDPQRCASDGTLKELYPRTFKDEDLNADVFSARRVTEHFHYRMMRCERTGLVFSSEILPDDVLQKLYADSKVTFNEYTQHLRNDYWNAMKPYATSFKKEKALEIGCSTGFFLDELLEQGYADVYGCEPSSEAIAMASPSVKKNIYPGFFKSGVYENNFFDLVCSFQTLDHLSEPLEMLKVMYDVLKPGGHAYLITHDVESFQAKLFGEKSPIIDVEHIYLFNKKTLPMIGEKAGFKRTAVFDIRNTYPLKYWVGHAPIPGKKIFLALMKATGLENVTVSIKPGNIGVLLQKPLM